MRGFLDYGRPRRVIRKLGSLVDGVIRRATATDRVLPDFVIIGAQKSGTTSLYNYLGQTPAVIALRSKEVHYFDNHLAKGTYWYRSRFCTEAELRAVSSATGAAAQTGEATPFYMFHPLCPERMRQVIPEARLIAVLREPVERAYSHYQHELRNGFETLGFDAAIAAEPDRLARELDTRGLAAFDDPLSQQRHASFCARGQYAPQLAKVLEHFARDRLLVVLSEELFADPQRVCDRASEFLGLPAGQLSSLKAMNQGGYDPSTVAGLSELRPRFADSNALLSDLGIEVPW